MAPKLDSKYETVIKSIVPNNVNGYKTLKKAIQNSKLSKNCFKFDDDQLEIRTTYSLTEWRAFLSRSLQLNLHIPYNLLNADKVKSVSMRSATFANEGFAVLPASYDQTELKYLERVDKTMYRLSKQDKPVIVKNFTNNPSVTELVAMNMRNNPGIVFGDNYHEQAKPKQILSQLMPTFKEQNIRVLYLEHFMQSQQQYIDEFLQTGIMTVELDVYLKFLETSYHGFRELLQAAHENSMEVIACETSTSYMLRGAKNAPTDCPERVKAGTLEMFNKIQQHQQPVKWIAFIGSAHLGNGAKAGGIKSLDELLGVPCITLEQSPHKDKTVMQFAQYLAGNTMDVNLQINDLNHPVITEGRYTCVVHTNNRSVSDNNATNPRVYLPSGNEDGSSLHKSSSTNDLDNLVNLDDSAYDADIGKLVIVDDAVDVDFADSDDDCVDLDRSSNKLTS